MNKLKKAYLIHTVLIQNFSYVTLLQFFLVAAPLITYPYLVKVLGMKLYGLVITAQVLSSYASLIIDFGSNSVCAKHVSVFRDSKNKLSEILSSVYIVRSILWLLCLFIYSAIVFIIPAFRDYWLLFLFSFGLTFNELLFPQFFFQGLEKMKYSTLINIGIKLLFIVLVFFFVKSKEDYIYVPILYTIGYTVAGVVSIVTIFYGMQLKLQAPKKSHILFYYKDALPIFATDMICTIKDKFSYFILAAVCGTASIIVYDLGIKINSILTKPVQIISTVLFPRFAKTRDTKKFLTVLKINTIVIIILVIVTNLFLVDIIHFFIKDDINIVYLRLFTLAPLFLSISSCIASNLFVAFGYNKYMLYSILVTTATYLVLLLIFYLTDRLNVNSFIIIAVTSYFVELVYRLIKARIVIKDNQ